jgi:hypothetical protein
MTVSRTTDTPPPVYEQDAAGQDNQGPELDHLRREVARLTHLLGSHADGHRCTCTLTNPGNYNVAGGNAHPPEWEQDPWCPTHPAVDTIREWVTALAEQWHNEADANEDEHPTAARVTRCCSKELHEVLRRGAL